MIPPPLAIPQEQITDRATTQVEDRGMDILRFGVAMLALLGVLLLAIVR